MRKTKENLNIKNKKSDFTKLTRSGISLIVLVITIIVIVILASAVILSISNNNPVVEANVARYESDCANMQAIFTNTVAKVMAKNKGVVKISYGQINEIVSGQKEATGQVEYIVVDAQNSDNTSGKIIFDKGDNKEVEYYTGKKLPIYAAGDTKWYVDAEGCVSVIVAEEKYGVGDVINKEDIVLINGSSFKSIIPNAAMSVIFTDEKAPKSYTLENGSLIDVSENKSGGIVAWLEDNTFKVSTQKSGIDIIANKSCYNMFSGKSNLKDIKFIYFDASNVTDMMSMFNGCSGLTNLDLKNFKTENLKSLYYTFSGCVNLESIDFSSFKTNKLENIQGMLYNCENLTSVNVKNWDTSNLNVMSYAFYKCKKLTKIDLSDWDLKSNISISNAFTYCYAINEAYVKTQLDADRLNEQSGKPTSWEFTVKNMY